MYTNVKREKETKRQRETTDYSIAAVKNVCRRLDLMEEGGVREGGMSPQTVKKNPIQISIQPNKPNHPEKKDMKKNPQQNTKYILSTPVPKEVEDSELSRVYTRCPLGSPSTTEPSAAAATCGTTGCGDSRRARGRCEREPRGATEISWRNICDGGSGTSENLP